MALFENVKMIRNSLSEFNTCCLNILGPIGSAKFKSQPSQVCSYHSTCTLNSERLRQDHETEANLDYTHQVSKHQKTKRMFKLLNMEKVAFTKVLETVG